MIHALNDNASARPVTGRMVLLCLVGFFGVVIGVNAVLIRAAVTTFGGLETPNAYQAGLAYEQEIEAAHAQDALHWRVNAGVHPAGGETVIDIEARDEAGRPLAGLGATATLVHPVDARTDQPVTLHEDKTGHFTGSAALAAGQWELTIELSRDGRRMFRSRNRVVLN